MSERYARGQTPVPLLLQERDRQILASIYRHRWMRTDQIQHLHFPDASDRVCRERVRRLWLAHLLDREFLQLVVAPDGGRPREAYAGSAVYCLSRDGALVLSDYLGMNFETIPHTIEQNRRGYANLRHNLIGTDFFVALEASCAEKENPRVLSVNRESELWERLREKEGHVPHDYLVPDGAVTLGSSAGKPMTFYIEVVRVDPRGGNRALVKKLARYVELNRQGYFREIFGHEHIRAVLILTPTETRAENLRQLANEHLAHGRNFFWFGSYEMTDNDGRKKTNLLPETILEPRFFSVDGEPKSLTSVFDS